MGDMLSNVNWKRLIINTVFSLVIPVGIFFIFAVLTGGRTATMAVFTATVRQSIVPILICYGLIINMSVGMINFSAGAMMLCAGIIGGNLARVTGTGVVGLALFCLVLTVAMGAFTGFLYNKILVPSMILTIGMLLVWEGLPRFIFPSGVSVPTASTVLASTPHIYVIFGMMVVAFHFLFNKTAFGHNLRAIGNNQAIAISAGLDIDKIKLFSFISGSIFLGVAATLHISTVSTLRNVSSMGSMQIMMDGFMGMFMAMFLSKFANMSIAVVIGTFSMRMLTNGFVAMGLSSTARDIVQGLFLLVLLAISANAGIFEKRRADKEFAAEADKNYLQSA